MHPRFEDLARPPRPVPFPLFAGVMNNFYLCFGTFFFAFGMIFFWIFTYPSLREFRFWFAGELTPARGTLIATERTSYSVGGGKHSRGTPVYRYRFQFPDAQGEMREGLSYATGDRLGAAHYVEVEFDPDDPSISRILGGRASPFGLFTLFVVLFPGIGLLFVVGGVRTGLRSARLLAEGKVAAGRIVSKRATNTRINKQTVMDFEVEFATFGGQRVTFHHKTHQVAEIGDELEEPVFYDPRNPQDAVLADGLPARPVLGPGGHWQARSGAASVILFAAMALAHLGHLALGLWILRSGA